MAYAEDKKPAGLSTLTTLASDDTIIVGDTSDPAEVVKTITKANLITDLSTSFAAALGADDNYMTDAEKTKLAGIETGADVTDATNVAAAGAVMESDTSTASMSFVVDEDDMASNSATKVPTQQSVKAYVDANSGGGGDVSKVGTPANNQVAVWTGDGTIEGDTALTFDTTTDTLTIAASGNLAFGAVTVLDDNAGTTTLQNIDAIDATTESTLESAIDALPNLTTVLTSLTGVLRADSGVLAVDTDVTDIVAAASDTAAGKVELATNAETVTGTDTARATTPANITARLAAPGTIGGTTPGAATFTTVTVNTGVILSENASIALDPAGSADGKYTGITVAGTAGATLAFGDLCYLSVTDSRWELADADAASTSGDVLLGMCVQAAAADGNATTMLLYGIIRADTAFPALTVGAPVYVSTTAGDIQVAQPSGTDDVIRVVGYALTADEIAFQPSNSYVTRV